MRKKNNQYEYIAVYVDDLAIAIKNPKGSRLPDQSHFILVWTSLEMMMVRYVYHLQST
jgi:hypothetical protein